MSRGDLWPSADEATQRHRSGFSVWRRANNGRSLLQIVPFPPRGQGTCPAARGRQTWTARPAAWKALPTARRLEPVLPAPGPCPLWPPPELLRHRGSSRVPLAPSSCVDPSRWRPGARLQRRCQPRPRKGAARLVGSAVCGAGAPRILPLLPQIPAPTWGQVPVVEAMQGRGLSPRGGGGVLLSSPLHPEPPRAPDSTRCSPPASEGGNGGGSHGEGRVPHVPFPLVGLPWSSSQARGLHTPHGPRAPASAPTPSPDLPPPWGRSVCSWLGATGGAPGQPASPRHRPGCSGLWTGDRVSG